MKKYWIGLLGVVGIFTTEPIWAENDCTEINSSQDILKCALSRSPDVLRSEDQLRSAEKLVWKASQLPNPSLETDGVYGRSLGNGVLEAEAAITQPIELGSKRGSRKEMARAQIEKAKASLKSAKERTAIETIVSLFELTQIKHQLDLLNEGLATFRRIQKKYRKRSSLSPENEVSLGIFELATSDYQIHKSQDSQRKMELERRLEISTGLSLDTIRKNLPRLRRHSELPSIDSLRQNETIMGSQMRQALAQKKIADASLSIEQSEAWPDLEIGPKYVFSDDGGIKSHQYGLSLSIPLPFWNRNSGGKAVAERELQSASNNVSIVKTELSTRLETLLQSYSLYLNTLKKLPTFSSLEKKHQKMEKLIQRGLVSNPLVIEAHRQLLDYSESFHEQYIRTVELLWTIYALQGRIEDEQI